MLPQLIFHYSAIYINDLLRISRVIAIKKLRYTRSVIRKEQQHGADYRRPMKSRVRGNVIVKLSNDNRVSRKRRAPWLDPTKRKKGITKKEKHQCRNRIKEEEEKGEKVGNKENRIFFIRINIFLQFSLRF